MTFGEGSAEGLDTAAIGVGNVRVEGDYRFRVEFGDDRHRAVPIGAPSGERLADVGEVGTAVGDRVDQAAHGRFGLSNTPLCLRPRSGALGSPL